MTTSNEFFYLDENGKKQDADLHDEILDNPEADAVVRAQSLAKLRSQGFTEEEFKRLFKL